MGDESTKEDIDSNKYFRKHDETYAEEHILAPSNPED